MLERALDRKGRASSHAAADSCQHVQQHRRNRPGSKGQRVTRARNCNERQSGGVEDQHRAEEIEPVPTLYLQIPGDLLPGLVHGYRTGKSVPVMHAGG